MKTLPFVFVCSESAETLIYTNFYKHHYQKLKVSPVVDHKLFIHCFRKKVINFCKKLLLSSIKNYYFFNSSLSQTLSLIHMLQAINIKRNKN